MVAAFDAGEAASIALAAFLVLLGLAAGFALYRLGRLFDRVSSLIRGTERELLPVLQKGGATVDRVNWQLDKLDTVTDSAVGMADSADTAVRAVSTAIAKPVEKVSGLAAGLAHGISSLIATHDLREAFEAAKEAARQREQDLADDLRGEGPAPSVRRPDLQPAPTPWPRPAPAARLEDAPEPPKAA
ncbi:MAG: DUF948 domain-containing protein [Thermoleophilia bacterium]|nr:DUF948 domain-containing protein [Thermoleophilia bacterium]